MRRWLIRPERPNAPDAPNTPNTPYTPYDEELPVHRWAPP